ncbi:MAG: RtcB family protein [Candidatus Marinimicrobia bacterium]|nr:RtcB family protein [Candidatus Neomarinimicrobiota bacterium]
MVQLKQINEYIWEVPKTGKMRVPGRIYADRELMKGIANDPCIEQVQNVAHLPGIIQYSFAMPDIHWGYGFPIGGVAAMDIDEGVISPGGVGYDINCGVRLLSTGLHRSELQPQIRTLLAQLFRDIPSGVGSQGAIPNLGIKALDKILLDGVTSAVNMGFASKEDILFIEEHGCLKGADPERVSQHAKLRGSKQIGTLGSGNHFLEVDYVEEIYDNYSAEVLGLKKDQIVVIIHTGSRGLGYQVCTDYLKMTQKAVEKYRIELPDRQLACSPIQSPEGQAYLGAMRAAANFAFVNRQVIKHLTEKAFIKALAISQTELKMKLIYDICHNVAKFEEHTVDGKKVSVCVHRKGATRAFGPHHPELPESYKEIGQPVLVPGDMGRYSYLCIGTEKAMQETFGSSCHGAGRMMSRKKSSKISRSMNMIEELRSRGVEIMARGKRTIAEEMPHAYKDVSNVVDVMDGAGISKKVARFRPIGVIKG